MPISIPQKPKIVKTEGNRAVFEIEGLHPGYGVTLGNALRRVMLSSLPGAAVVGIKIKGVQHEFSTILHVAEDVIEIILNLRQIRFKLYSDQPVRLNLVAKGEKEAKAGDIKTTSEVEIINPEVVIANLTSKKAELEMEIEIDKGLGFVPVEARKKEKLEIGYIAVDSQFAPIRKVNFETENMRVGDRTDYNRLRIDIETDGSVTPEEAFNQSNKILVEQFKALIGEETTEKSAAEQTDEATQDPLKTKIEDLKFSVRTANALLAGGVKIVGSLVKKNEVALREIEGLGDKGINEINKALRKLGLGLKE
jgi:DNA-directed RNA polymerase subunit alpha